MYTSIIDEFPLILKATLRISHLKRLHSHYEVINKFLRDSFETSISIIDPLIVEDLIFIWAFHIIDIKDYLTEVHIGYPYIPIKSSIEQICIRADDFNIDMKLDGQPKSSADPKTSHKQYNFIRSQRIAKGLKIPIECLLCIIHILCKVL